MRSSSLLAAALSTSSLVSGLEWSDNRDGGFSLANAGPDHVPNRRVWNRPAKRQSGGWSPPSDLAVPLKQVWNHCLNTYSDGLFGFKNYGWDQLMATKGKINMCVRWESTAKVTETQRAQIATALNDSYQQWFQWLYGYDGFPFSKVEVNVVGWAVKDKALLEGSTAGVVVYTDVDAQGIPQCAESCGRFFHQDGDYSGCEAGADKHYDQSLSLTDGMAGGAGGDWGQRIGREYMTGAVGSGNIHILLHEMGHTYGLDDFYDWTPTGVSSFIMLAGSSSKITDFDGWMLRNWWYQLSRKRGWQSGTDSSPTSAVLTSTAAAPSASTSVANPVNSLEATPSANPHLTTSSSARPTSTAGAQPTGARPGSSCGKQRKVYES